MPNLSIKTKIIAAMLLVGLVPILVVGFVSLQTSQAELEKEVFNKLSAVAEIKTTQIENYFFERKADIKVLSIHPAVQQGSVGQTFDFAESTDAQVELRQKSLVDYKNEYGYYDMFLISPSGDVWWTAEKESDFGTNLVTGPYKDTNLADLWKTVVEHKEIEIVDFKYYAPSDGPAMFIGAPVFMGDNMIGVVVLQISIDQINEIMQEQSGLGETGETYLVGENYLMMSDSRFEENTILNRKVETDGVKEVFKTKKLERGSEHCKNWIYEDYRGIKVLGHNHYIHIGEKAVVVEAAAEEEEEDIRWAVMVEIDEAEAFAGIKETGFKILQASGLFAIFVFFIALILSSRISKPIIKLQHDTEIIEKGDLDHKVGYEGGGEIGQLARAFDSMTVAIKKSRAEIDEKVKSQTQEIIDKQKSMEDSQKAVLNILEDVDEEKQKTEVERDKIDAILHSIGDGVFVVDKDLKVIVCNQVTADISGFTVEEILGKRYDKILKFIGEQDGKINNKFIKNAIKTGEVQEMANHTLLVKKDGEKVPVADSAAPLKNKKGEIIGCVVVFRDVTKERSVDRAKTEFVSLASHQLRTPLSTINWYAEMLLDGDAGEVTKEQKEYLDEIYTGNQRMVNLVNALLNVSRIDMGTLVVDPQPTDVRVIVEDVLKEFELQIKEKNIDIKNQSDENLPKIKVDPKMIRIAFQNLISNAIKYTHENGKVDIKTVVENKEILFRVKDSGLGIPKNQQDKIFDKLFRADNVQTKDTTGTGLGLYVTKSIIKQSGGRIWFRSEENKGTTFYITIPFKGMEKKKGTKELKYIG